MPAPDPAGSRAKHTYSYRFPSYCGEVMDHGPGPGRSVACPVQTIGATREPAPEADNIQELNHETGTSGHNGGLVGPGPVSDGRGGPGPADGRSPVRHPGRPPSGGGPGQTHGRPEPAATAVGRQPGPAGRTGPGPSGRKPGAAPAGRVEPAVGPGHPALVQRAAVVRPSTTGSGLHGTTVRARAGLWPTQGHDGPHGHDGPGSI